MNQYVNPYFRIKIEFPGTWRYRYWGNRTSIPKYPHQYQVAYDDLPSGLDSYKELFSAHSTIKSHRILGTMIAVAVFYKPNDFNISDERPVFDAEIKRQKGDLIIHNKPAKFLYIESNFNNKVMYSSLYCWQHEPNMWLFFGVQGDTIENYQEALSIFNTMRVF